jgi:hypothetical protein
MKKFYNDFQWIVKKVKPPELEFLFSLFNFSMKTKLENNFLSYIIIFYVFLNAQAD